MAESLDDYSYISEERNLRHQRNIAGGSVRLLSTLYGCFKIEYRTYMIQR